MFRNQPATARWLTICTVILVSGCGSETAPGKTNHSKNDNSDQTGLTSLFVADLSRAAVDISTLSVRQLSVGRKQLGSVIVGSVSFNATGEADFAEVTVCPSAGCERSLITTTNRLLLKPYSSGKIIVKVKACVEEERAKTAGVNCGAEESFEFIQPDNIDSVLASYLTEREQKRLELKDYATKLRHALTKFDKESEDCAAQERSTQKYAALRTVVKNFLRLSEKLIQKAIDVDNADKKSDSAALVGGTPVDRLATPLANANSSLASFEEYNSAVKEIAEAVGLFQAAKPVNAVQTLGTAIFDLFTAKKQVIGQCLAKDNADREIAAIYGAITTIKTRITWLDAKIQGGPSQ